MAQCGGGESANGVMTRNMMRILAEAMFGGVWHGKRPLNRQDSNEGL
jgi:hypothetical protein